MVFVAVSLRHSARRVTSGGVLPGDARSPGHRAAPAAPPAATPQDVTGVLVDLSKAFDAAGDHSGRPRRSSEPRGRWQPRRKRLPESAGGPHTQRAGKGGAGGPARHGSPQGCALGPVLFTYTMQRAPCLGAAACDGVVTGTAEKGCTFSPQSGTLGDTGNNASR